MSKISVIFNFTVFLSSAGINMLALAAPFVLLQIYDRIIPNNSIETLSLLMAGFMTALLLEVVLKYSRHVVLSWRAVKFEHNANISGFEKILKADNTEFKKSGIGLHLERMMSIDRIREFLSDETTTFIADLPFVFLFLGLMFILNPIIAIIPIVIILTAFILTILSGKKLSGFLKQRSISDDERYNFLIEVLAGIQTVKSFGIEPLMERRYENFMQRSAFANQKISFFANLNQSIAAICSEMTTISVACIGSLFVISGSMSIGTLAASVLLSARIVQPCLRAFSFWSRFQVFNLAQKRLDEVYSLKQEQYGGIGLNERINKINIQDVSLYAETGSHAIFENINLTINAGDTISLSGVNGAGKSALLSLLFGSLQPSKGHIEINDVPLNEYDIGSVRKKIAFLPQTPKLLSGKIIENLTCFNVKDNMFQALDLAKQTGLDKVIGTLPDGIDTAVDPTNEHILSLGAVQHISFVRGLIGEPNLILFDEANSAVDYETDVKLREVLTKYQNIGATIILVSHRPSLLAIANRHFKIENNKLIEKTDDDNLEDASQLSRQSYNTEQSMRGII